jgi:hypothetical protein
MRSFFALRFVCFASLTHCSSFGVCGLRFALRACFVHKLASRTDSAIDSASAPPLHRCDFASLLAKPRRFALRLCSLARFAPLHRLRTLSLAPAQTQSRTAGQCSLSLTCPPETGGDKNKCTAAPPPAAWHPPTLSAATCWSLSLPHCASSNVCLVALGGRGFFAYADAEERRAANVRSAHWLVCAFVFENRAASGKEH